jgi:hypothetical protein
MTKSSSLGVISSNVRSEKSGQRSGVIDQQYVDPFGVTYNSQGGGARIVTDSIVTVPVNRYLMITLNITMAIFHSSLVFLTFFFGKIDLEGKLYKSEMLYNHSTPGFELIPTFSELENGLYLTVVTASFFIISALFHFGNATIWKNYYISELENCRAPTRWIEYFFSAAVMIVLISYGLGIRDVMLIFALAGLIATTMPYGYWTEYISRPKTLDEWNLPLRIRLTPYILGHIPQLTAWGVLIASFYDESDMENIPVFVHGILWGELALFFSFGFVQLGQQCSKPRHYVRGEIAYQILSFGSKGLLGGLLLANVLILSNFNEIYD